VRGLLRGASEGEELAFLRGEKFPAPLLAVFDQSRDRFIVALKLRDQPSDLAVAGSELTSRSAVDREIHLHTSTSENGESRSVSK
jgi:hypothetical protein